MSQLIAMRQRMQTVQTIKRITHAMRLVSRSSHARLSRKLKLVQLYHHHTTTIFNNFCLLHPTAPTVYSLLTPSQSNLIILVGSQKGLCGGFNTGLFHFFDTYLKKTKSNHPEIISVGKKTVEFTNEYYKPYVGPTFAEFNPVTVLAITNAITECIFSKSYSLQTIQVISNKIKSFFVYSPFATTLIPSTTHTIQPTMQQEELWIEENPTIIFEQLVRIYITSTIQATLFESLLAEHAARFISMDNATHNADTILEDTHILYNKLRQTKITKDLIELTSAF